MTVERQKQIAAVFDRWARARRLVQRLHPAVGHLIQPIFAVGARGLEVATKLVFQIVVARALGADEAGLFLLGLSIVTIVGAAAKFAIDRALLRSVARARAHGASSAILGEILASLGLILAISGTVGVLMFLFATPIASGIFGKPAFAEPLRWLALMMAALCLLNGMVGAITALGAAAIGDVLRNFVWPAVCAILMLLGARTAATAALSATFGVGLALLAGWFLLRRLLPVRWPGRSEFRLPPMLFAIAAPLAVVDTIDVILISVPTLVLGALASNGEVAIFSIANRVALIFIAILSAIGNAASPRFALMAGPENRSRLGRTVRDITALATVACLPVAIGLMVFPGAALSIFGPAYAAGATTLRILVAGDIVFVAFGCGSELLAMTGHGRALQPLRLVLLVVCVALSFTLIPLYGAIGAALATTVTVAMSGVLSGIAVRRHLHLPVIPLLTRVVAER